MADLGNGETIEVKGSSAKPYVLKNTGGVYSCSCPAWRNQGGAIDRRTCKHLRQLRGADVEAARIGAGAPSPVASATAAAVATTSAPPLLLAHSWTADIDPTGWWMSEKLDGGRAYWNGSTFISRLGNAFAAPAWFTERLPSTTLDGELWMGRKRFQACVSAVRSAGAGDAWREIAFVIFDAPDVSRGFEERMDHCRSVLDGVGSHVRVIETSRCEGVDGLRAELARIEALGGEGIMLRQAGSRYEVGRSTTLLKVKTFRDAEARVVAHADGRGKHKGRLGALVVELPNGTQFNIGTGFSDDERRSPPPIGATVTFRYQELTDAGVPRFPSFMRERTDVAA